MTPARLIVILVGINLLLIAIGALVIGAPPKPAGTGMKVALVFDIGGKNDRSFNEAAYRGLERAKAELGVETTYIEPTEGADREAALRTMAAAGNDLVIGVGFIFGPDLERLAKQFPAVKFAGIDYSPSKNAGEIPNLAGLAFREHEGSFLVGAIAGMVTRTKVVGFVGGMKIPLIGKFEAGYAAGVHHVCPTCEVRTAYAGSEPKAFADPTKGAELATSQYGAGADIIYHASGRTGDGVFAVARRTGKLAIGVDSNQYSAAPCCVLTSMVKRVDVAVVDIIRDLSTGKFTGGVHELGLAEEGVGFVADERNRRLLPLEVVNKAKKLGEQIIAKKIVVPDRP
jgi:basic membrane protein A and related proteins